MIVALSADALGDAPLDDVIAACERRGINAVCLDVSSVEELAGSCEQLRSRGIDLAAFRFASVADISPESAANTAATLRTVLLNDARLPRPWADAFAAAGGTLTDAVELDPRIHNVAEQLHAVADLDGLPSHIVLRGGGPEAAQFEGRGIGSLMAQLSVAGYRGVLILAPSERAMRQIWKTWLFNRRGWGCGSKASAPVLVEIQ